MSKVIITLPAKYEHVEIFEQTVIGSFSCVNNRLTFDTDIITQLFRLGNERKKRFQIQNSSQFKN